MPHQVGVFGNFTAVDADLPFIFKNRRFNRHFTVTVFGFGADIGVFRAHTNQLFIVADTKRSARAKVKDRLSAVGFALCVLPEKDVQPVRKLKVFVFVISKILKE